MLVASRRHTARDLEHWRTLERTDEINAARMRERLDRMVAAAAETARAFIADGPCYAGVSWGKDSVALAHCLALHGVRVPFVWIRIEGHENPDCPLVRDAFLRQHDVDYHEIVVPLGKRRMSAAGFAEAARRFGARHLSGVRSEESRHRAIREARWGTTSTNTCAPLTRWTTDEVFALLHAADLPVHPAYACTMGGLLDRRHLRVSALGGKRGQGHGRAEWERRYYPEELRRLGIVG